MTYKFKIDNDYLAEEEYFDGVSGNKNIYLCEFDITCDESSAVWFAVFKKDEEIYIVPVNEGKCNIPYEVLENSGTVYLGCYAECAEESRISTNWIPLAVEEGAYSEGTAPQPPGEELWETLLKNSVPVIGENGNWFTYDMAEEGYVDTGFCARGEKGQKGDRGAAGYTPQKGVDYFTQADIAEIAQNFEPTATKQDTLVSGTNIKTVNGASILGSGNLNVLDGVCNTPYDEQTNKIATMADIAGVYSPPKTWEDVQAIVRSGAASKYFNIGDQFVVEKLSSAMASKGTSTGISGVTVNPAAFILGVGKTHAGTYLFAYDGKSWRNDDGKVVLLEDYGISVTGTPVVGDNIEITETTTQLTFDVIGIDHDTPINPDYTHSMTLQLHDQLDTPLVFSSPEAAFYIDEDTYPNGLVAGTYNFTWGYNTGSVISGTYQFTLTRDIPSGGQIVIIMGSDSVAITSRTITTYDSVGNTSIIESNVGITAGSEGTSLGTINSATITNGNVNCGQRIIWGSNNWFSSGIRQWLNTDKDANTWWEAKTVFSRPNSTTVAKDGFLKGIDPAFLGVIGEVTKTTQKSVSEGYGLNTTCERFFLLSRPEIYGGTERGGDGADGKVYAYYGDGYSDLSIPNAGANTNRIKYRNGSASYWWLRTPYAAFGNFVRFITPTGALSDNNAVNSHGVVPACVIV